MKIVLSKNNLYCVCVVFLFTMHSKAQKLFYSAPEKITTSYFKSVEPLSALTTKFNYGVTETSYPALETTIKSSKLKPTVGFFATIETIKTRVNSNLPPQTFCEGTSGNQLVNPSFEVPVQTNVGNNILTWPINGWTGEGSAPNVVKANGTSSTGGPISAQEGIQYLDITNGSADFYQEFNFECNTQVFFSGYFSVRDGLASTGRIDIIRVNSDNTTDIVASSNQLNMPSTANIWYLASGNAALPTGEYRFQISMGDHSNFDSACFSFENPNIDTGSYDPLCESSSITLTGTPTDSFGTWTGNGIVDNGDGTASFNPSGLGGTIVPVTYSHFNASGFGCSQSTNIEVNSNVIPAFTQVTAIFDGETLEALPTTSNNGVTGTWSPAINNTETTTYTFTPDDLETCAINQNMTISVNPVFFTVTVNSEIICSSGIAIIVATPSPAGLYSYTWIVPEGVSNPGNVQSFSTSIEGDYSVSITKDNYLCNTDFEENQLGILGSFSIVHQDSVPCWETTASDSQIEVWGDEMIGIDAYSGNQFIELNANMQSTLFQNFEIIPGSSVILSFAHRGRNSSADDIMEVEIGPIGGPYVNLGAFSDGIDSWGYYSLEYDLPDDLGINYTIRFKSIQPAGSLGNFLDDISVVFPSDVSSEIATGNVSIITEITPTFTQVPTICFGDTLSALLTTSNDGITGIWSPSLDTTTTTTYTFTPDADQCATAVNMTIAVNPNITPTFTQIPEICPGDPLSALLTTSNNGITGAWSPSLDNTTTTTYTFTPDAGQCAETVNMTIAVNPNITPTFTQIPEICPGDTLSALLTTSNNGITGAWSPSLDNTTTTTYTFTPDAGQCAETVNMTIDVNSNITPTFTQVPTICFGDTLSALLTTSNDGITGAWSPSLDTTTTTTYTFIPDADQCATAVNMTITVNPNITPTFTQIPTICSGDALSALLTTSNNGISGTWSPSLDTTTTTTYTFTPDAGQCGTTVNMTITVNPNITPTFTQVPTICSGDPLSALLTTSNNGITGTWSPSLNNTTTTTYTFTPGAGQCGTTENMTITVNPLPPIPSGNAQQTFCAIDNPIISDLVFTASSIYWYQTPSGGSPLSLNFELTDGLTLYAASYDSVSNCENPTRAQVDIQVENPVLPSIDTEQVFCLENSITLADVNTNGVNMNWYDNSIGGNLVPLTQLLQNGDLYYGASFNATTACESTSRIPLKVTFIDSKLSFFNLISIDYNNLNKELFIEGIERFPNNSIKIYNRYGNLVWSAINYDNLNNAFIGMANVSGVVSKGSYLPTGTYFFMLSYPNDCEMSELKGFLQIDNKR